MAGAIEALLHAAEAYRQLPDRLGLAQVSAIRSAWLALAAAAASDHAGSGSLRCLSLVDKTLLGDLPGMAITLGNLGRTHLRDGRFREAIDCFQRDLEIAERLDSDFGRARMHGDLGTSCCLRAPKIWALAEREIEASLALARRRQYRKFEFLALKDRALLRLLQVRPADAAADLVAAETIHQTFGDPARQLLIAATRGKLLLAQNDARLRSAKEWKHSRARGFRRGSKLPDWEIPTRIDLAAAYLHAKQPYQAERCLLIGLELARGDGYARYLSPLNEAMAALNLVEGAIEETGRTIANSPTHDSQSSESLPDGYIVRRRLGGGAFGEVFQAYDPQRNCDVALKRLHLERLYDVDQRKRLLNSARLELAAASRVRHPGVVRVRAIGVDRAGNAYVTQEFVEGSSLRERMPADTSAVVEVVVPCLAKIAGALAALHAAGVIHRDLKPENILIRPDESPVLVDFGICRVAGFGEEAVQQIAGTLLYMAPEQALGKRIDTRADLYALGVVAYEWLAGVLPIRPWGETFSDMARDVAERSPQDIAAFRPNLEPGLAKLVMQLLEKKPRRRPASASAVSQQLAEYIAARDHDGGIFGT